MVIDFLRSLPSHAWPGFLALVFLECTIFVHELGHYLSARWRGVRVERFSIGLGPAIWSWRGKDGILYKIAWIPIGGFVLLPQLADLGAIEGKTETDASKLPPVDYASKMIIFAAGAAFNLLFAFVLACALWVAGTPVSDDAATTQIGYVTPTLELADGTKVPSPASEAGLRPGDRILAIDGQNVSDWNDLTNTLIMGAGRTQNGKPRSVFTIDRDGSRLDIVLLPILTGEEGLRHVGIAPAFTAGVFKVSPGSPADKAGFREGDSLVSIDGAPARNPETLEDRLEGSSRKPIDVVVARAGKDVHLSVAPLAGSKADFGVLFDAGFHMVHRSPFAELWSQVTTTLQTLRSLFNPRSDIGLSKMSGAVGIIYILGSAASSGLRALFEITILFNVNLAILMLLPIPVLDGGQMLFATLSRIRGRALPVDLVATVQGVFVVLIFSVILYVTFFDVRRVARDAEGGHAPPAPAAQK